MATFSLLRTVPLWKKVITVSDGRYEGTRWVEGNSTVDYVEFQGRWQPYTRGEAQDNLPSGVKSSDIVRVWSEDILSVGSDLEGKQKVPDIIYLDDPRITPNIKGFTVYDREDWRLQGKFRLIKNNFNCYICIRLPKGTTS